MNPIIKLENIDFFYDKGNPSEVHALNNINLEIYPGEYISFFGPSGCGKSTILYVIAGVEKPDKGKTIVNGQDLMKFSEREIAIYRQIGIGIIFQSFNLIPSIKVIDNVILPMSFLGISTDKREKRAMEILDRLGISNLSNRYPFELSGGQQQRVGIARALANDPPIILADEPIGNLDSANAQNVLDLLKEFNQKDGKTIIMVTHEAWSLKDVNKIFYMRDGAITKTEDKKAEFVERGASSYYKKLFPELPNLETRAKTIAALILRGYSYPEIKRFEYFLAQLLKGLIEKDVFKMVLDRPYNLGGVGLWRQKAEKIADYVDEIMGEEKELNIIYQKLEKAPESPLCEEIMKIRDWLLQGVRVKLTPLQTERLNEIVGERIRNIITAENFQKVLDLSREKGGVGLKVRTSFKLSEKLESLLGRENMELAM